ncbi:MAG: AmmeMemoRadiSam system radical SAM enzyme [Eubacterium sp.]|nr:AmmeMemoRadiSam system radical SAM enzyme [Eubacterium sp.]
MSEMITCDICFHRCRLSEGQTGFCHARRNIDGENVSLCYGKLTSLALDPIEKKPLYHFHPGSMILSVGSFGCNLACPFCQNVEISLADKRDIPETEEYSPEELVKIAMKYRPDGNIGIAFTYNEPLINYEFILDTAKLMKLEGLKTVLVTNGNASRAVLDKLGPYIDAMNVDLKSYDRDYYEHVLHGSFAATTDFIERALTYSHIEVTTLIIPDENDNVDEMRAIASYLSDLIKRSGKDIPLHISRFFPRSQYSDRQPTPVETVHQLVDIAKVYLPHVYAGNC